MLTLSEEQRALLEETRRELGRRRDTLNSLVHKYNSLVWDLEQEIDRYNQADREARETLQEVIEELQEGELDDEAKTDITHAGYSIRDADWELETENGANINGAELIEFEPETEIGIDTILDADDERQNGDNP